MEYKFIKFALLSVFAIGSMATASPPGDDVNMEDKTQSFELTENGALAGKVTVKATYVGEPIAFPVQISVKVVCSPGFRVNRKVSQNWIAYDYGHHTNPQWLAQFDSRLQELIVHYRANRKDAEGRRSTSKNYPLLGACAR